MLKIRCGLGSRRLPCQCLSGIYETYDERVVQIIDVRHPRCHDPEHQQGKLLPVDEREPERA